MYELNVEESVQSTSRVRERTTEDTRTESHGRRSLKFYRCGSAAVYKSEVDQIPLDDLPEWLQDIIKDPLKFAAPEVFNLALACSDGQKEHIASSPANV